MRGDPHDPRAAGDRAESAGKNPSMFGIAQTAREAAYIALENWRTQGTFVGSSLDSAAHGLSPLDRSFAQELSYGVVRRQATLDALLESCLDRPRQKVEPALWTLLQLGAYQIGLMDGVALHAAVHETVELGRTVGPARWVGFANAVLRRVAAGRMSDGPRSGIRQNSGERPTTLEAASPASNAMPTSLGRYRTWSRAVFPEPQFDWNRYVAAAFSLPGWLVDRWAARWNRPELEWIAFWVNDPPPLWLRVNALRTTRDELLARLREAGVSAEPGDNPVAIRLDESTGVERLPGFAEGLFTVQDVSAMEAAARLDPQPGDHVLDLCAAPGTKTTHLAERMGNRGRILACDVHGERLARVTENARRLGVTIIEPFRLPKEGRGCPRGPFDRILIDAPCSNTGVLGRRPEARWRIAPKDLAELPAIQLALLNDAWPSLVPGGRLVYSTCSVEPEENADVVRRFLQTHPDASLAESTEFNPGRPGDGGFQAALVKRR